MLKKGSEPSQRKETRSGEVRNLPVLGLEHGRYLRCPHPDFMGQEGAAVELSSPSPHRGILLAYLWR